MLMRDTALIIMPLGSDPGYRNKKAAIDRAVTKAGLTSAFPKYEPDDPRFKPADFRKQLQRAAIVLADLTGERPSCYFELGFAEALERPVRLFAQAGTAIHQTAYRRTVRYYANTDQLEDAIIQALSSAEPVKAAFE
jgi:nucleoside 2-deoxyribosyltransferase